MRRERPRVELGSGAAVTGGALTQKAKQLIQEHRLSCYRTRSSRAAAKSSKVFHDPPQGRLTWRDHYTSAVETAAREREQEAAPWQALDLHMLQRLRGHWATIGD